MSWSFQGVGKPEALKRAIDTEASRYSGQSQAEFDAAAPHLKGLLDAADDSCAVSVNANGHASFAADGTKTNAYVSVEIKQLGLLRE